MAEEPTSTDVLDRLDRLADILAGGGVETAKNAGEVQDPMSVHVMNVMLQQQSLSYNSALADQQAKNIIQNAQLAGLVASGTSDAK